MHFQTRILLILISFFTIMFFASKSLYAQCHMDDWLALKAFYKNMDGDNWTDNLGWDVLKVDIPPANCNLNDLYGIHLNASGRVLCLDFDGVDNCQWDDAVGNNLNGAIPSQIGNLDALSFLNFRKNQVNGSIPPAIGELNNLTFLELSWNQLTGSIPVEIGNLSQLDYLNVGLNNLIGNLPYSLGKLKKLTELHLWSNQFSGTIPRELSSLNNLKNLNISGNQLTGDIPTELGNLNLTGLHLANNNLSGCYDNSLINLCNTFNSSIDNNAISNGNNFDANWEDFCNNQAGLCALANSECHIDDWIALKAFYENTGGESWFNKAGWEIIKADNPPLNCNLKNLYGVDLNSEGRVVSLDFDGIYDGKQSIASGNNLKGNIPAELGLLSELERLLLDNNNLSGEIPVEIAQLGKVKNISFYNNQLSGNIPIEIGSLSNLKFLSLGENQLTGSLPKELGNLNSLVQLGISNNPDLTGNIPTELGNLCQLESLSLAACQLTGNIPAQLGELSKLERLRLSNNQLSESIPPELSKLNNLNELDLAWNELSGNIPNELSNLLNLSILKLSGNQLNGSIPKGLGNLTMLIELSLNYNQLTGNIPFELGNLNKLNDLSLEYNQLTGNIPAQFGNLNNLASLNLSFNQLGGNIPDELTNTGNLKILYLQNNQLCGIVPNFKVNLLMLHTLNLSNNYFTCPHMSSNFQPNLQINDFTYLPQYFIPVDYTDIQTNVIDTLNNNKQVTLSIQLPWENTNDFTYQWKKNRNIIEGANQSTYVIHNVQPNTVGKYTLYVSSNNCLPNGTPFESISETIYVILKGYDLYGQPVEYDQIMVEFDNSEETKQYEAEILTPNAGWRKEACNCNRELYLWQFPSTQEAATALIKIDEKERIIKKRGKAKGGFNNILSIGEPGTAQIAYNVKSDAFNYNYPDPVSVYILDTGLDEKNYDASSFLYHQASIDSCYNIMASGYSYLGTTISTNYSDDLGHGTFGFRSISDGLKDNTNLKLVPLKIFNENGEGTLFDMVCALYHAIDHNADIINISAGYQGEPSGILESALNLAREKGIFITAAAGNDTLNMDNEPQYPAYYARRYYKFYLTNKSGDLELDSVKLNNVISVASINAAGNLSPFSNYGKQSVTISAPGENILGYGLEGKDEVASGTSVATNFATRALALEIGKNNNRDYQEIWSDFETSWLVENPSLLDITQTGKQINFELETAEGIEGCMDETNCNYFPYATINNKGDCLPAFIIANYETSNLLQANDSITSNNILEPLDTIIYKAGDEIILKIGFEVKKETTFSAEIECK